MQPRRSTVLDVLSRKGQEPLAVLTAYTARMAELLDPHVDILLVGDSLGMVIYGMESTLGVTLEMMIAHGKAVVRGSKQACVVVDLPFGSYQAAKEDAFRSAARLISETGCSAVKLEGGREMAETISYLAARGIPVMGHVGLTPQHVNALGGYRYQGRSPEARERLLADAKAVAEAGAFACVIEGVAEPVGRDITAAIAIPTIGIGASPSCDGQVLVIDDMLGMFARTPRFVKQYASLRDAIEAAAKQYGEDVRARAFPAAEHCFGKQTAESD